MKTLSITPSILAFAVGVACTLCQAESSAQVIQGQVIFCSQYPKPEESAYADCLYSVELEVKSVIEGSLTQNRIILLAPAFLDRRLHEYSGLQVSDRIQVDVTPIGDTAPELRQIQVADQVEDFMLDVYYAQSIIEIDEFAGNNAATAAPSATPYFGFRGIPSSDYAESERKRVIEEDLLKIESQVKEHGGFDAWFKQNESARKGYIAAIRARQSQWHGASFFSAGGAQLEKPERQNFVEVMITLNRMLRSRDIDLILLRIPSKGEVVADVFSDLPIHDHLNPYLLEVQRELLLNDVEIIDVVELARRNRQRFPLMYWYQDHTESHPAEGMSWIIAEALAERLKRYDFHTDYHQTLKLGTASRPIRDFRWPEGHHRYSPDDFVSFRAVLDQDGKPLAIAENNSSPVLFMGSSFTAYPDKEQAASPPHYFSYLMQMKVDHLYRAAVDSGMARFLLRKPDKFLQGRKVCIFPFHPLTIEQLCADIPTLSPPADNVIVFDQSRLAQVLKLPDNSTLFSLEADGLYIESRPGEEFREPFQLRFPVLQEHQLSGVQLTFSKPLYITIRHTTGGSSEIAALSTSSGRQPSVFFSIDAPSNEPGYETIELEVLRSRILNDSHLDSIEAHYVRTTPEEPDSSFVPAPPHNTDGQDERH